MQYVRSMALNDYWAKLELIKRPAFFFSSGSVFPHKTFTFNSSVDQAPHCFHLTCILTLNVPIATKVVCFSCLLKCLRSLYGKQCGPRSDCSYKSALFASILNLSVMLGKYLQQTTSADDIFRCIFSWRFKG